MFRRFQNFGVQRARFGRPARRECEKSRHARQAGEQRCYMLMPCLVDLPGTANETNRIPLIRPAVDAERVADGWQKGIHAVAVIFGYLRRWISPSAVGQSAARLLRVMTPHRQPVLIPSIIDMTGKDTAPRQRPMPAIGSKPPFPEAVCDKPESDDDKQSPRCELEEDVVHRCRAR